MPRMRVGVREVDSWTVGVQPDPQELEISMEGNGVGGCLIWYGYDTVVEVDGGGGVDRVHAHRVREFGDVVDAVAVDVGRVGDEVLLHPVAVYRQ